MVKARIKPGHNLPHQSSPIDYTANLNRRSKCFVNLVIVVGTYTLQSFRAALTQVATYRLLRFAEEAGASGF